MRINAAIGHIKLLNITYNIQYPGPFDDNLLKERFAA